MQKKYRKYKNKFKIKNKNKTIKTLNKIKHQNITGLQLNGY